jgi:hypothetical protein
LVKDISFRAEVWMSRTSEDIVENFEGQGYDYGLRMFTAFARVVMLCLQAHDGICVDILEQNQAKRLSIWNRIAQHRCRCAACDHLKQINKHHLATLPLWLCEEYEGEKDSIKPMLPPFIEQRKEELIKLFSHIPATRIAGSADPVQPNTEQVDPASDAGMEFKYTASVFCFWPQCQNYEIERLFIKIEPNEADVLKNVKSYLKKRRQESSKDWYEFVASIRKYSIKDEYDVIVIRPRQACDLKWTKAPSKLHSSEETSSQLRIAEAVFPDLFPILKDLCELKEAVIDDLVIDQSPYGQKNVVFALDSAGEILKKKIWSFGDFIESKDSVLKADEKDSVLNADDEALACSQPNQVTEVCLLLFLLDVIKHARKDEGGIMKLSSVVEEWTERKKGTVENKYDQIVKKFGEVTKVKVELDLSLWSSGCLECFMNQSIAFMSDLDQYICTSDSCSGVTPNTSSAADDLVRYSSYQDTIGQHIHNIKIDHSFISHSSDGAKNASSQSSSTNVQQASPGAQHSSASNQSAELVVGLEVAILQWCVRAHRNSVFLFSIVLMFFLRHVFLCLFLNLTRALVQLCVFGIA